MLCEAETTNSDVFQLAVAQNTAIYSVFEPAAKNHRNLRRFQQHGRQKHCYLRGFLHFRAAKVNVSAQQKRRKPSPKQLRNHKIWPPASRQDTWKKHAPQSRKSKTNSQKIDSFYFTFLLPVPGGRAHEPGPFRAAKDRVF